MKKIIFLVFIILSFLSINYSFAASDYENNYTLIDCLEWNDLTWEVFNSWSSFQSLKKWIESSIAYINTNVNIIWNENTASWKVFNIKVNCSMKDMLDNTIKLDFLWAKYNNELIIEWTSENALVFEDIKFNLAYQAWNIVFRNAKFDNYNFPYFYDYFYTAERNKINPSSNWIRIENSYIKLRNWLNLWNYTSSYSIYRYSRSIYKYYYYYSHYSNQQSIENSIIDIDISWNYIFKMPAKIKNSKISFINTWTWIYDISFIEEGNINSAIKFNFATLVSNEIDLWWNNFLSESSTNIAYLNNKFSNLNNFDLWWVTIYLNNLIENFQIIDISKNRNTYNNVFSWYFIDNYDLNNLRKNFNILNIWTSWIGWFYKKLNKLKYFNTDTSSFKLYKEVTGQDIPQSKDSIYVSY